jgi:hypothetical protein
VVAATGNGGINMDVFPGIMFPAQIEKVIGVGATAPFAQSDFDGLASYSNHGVDLVDLVAPGGNYTGDDRDLIIGPCSRLTMDPDLDCLAGETYIAAAGTSLSSPHVAGAAAVVRAMQGQRRFLGVDLNDFLAPTQACFLQNTIDLGEPNFDPLFGRGRLSVFDSVVDEDCGTVDSEEHTCGDGDIDIREDCEDDDNLDGAVCADLGYQTGTLACDEETCSFDVSGCADPLCGDDIQAGAEVCDGEDLANESCVTLGFPGGPLACATACDAYDTSACWVCGNGIIEGHEVCDDTALADLACEDLGYTGGTLGCSTSCDAYDTSACTTIPGGDCANAVDASSGSVTLTGTFDIDPQYTFDCNPWPTNAAWFTYTATTSGDHLFTATNSTTTPAWSYLVILDGVSCGPYDMELECASNSATFASATHSLVAGNTYTIAFMTDLDIFTMVDPSLVVLPPSP